MHFFSIVYQPLDFLWRGDQQLLRFYAWWHEPSMQDFNVLQLPLFVWVNGEDAGVQAPCVAPMLCHSHA